MERRRHLIDQSALFDCRPENSLTIDGTKDLFLSNTVLVHRRLREAGV
ncbi:hypothetical protein [Arthrobacter sp. ZBG10]|nr:hypothetical protein [Arthrobacter sp. ZBG10]